MEIDYSSLWSNIDGSSSEDSDKGSSQDSDESGSDDSDSHQPPVPQGSVPENPWALPEMAWRAWRYGGPMVALLDCLGPHDRAALLETLIQTLKDAAAGTSVPVQVCCILLWYPAMVARCPGMGTRAEKGEMERANWRAMGRHVTDVVRKGLVGDEGSGL